MNATKKSVINNNIYTFLFGAIFLIWGLIVIIFKYAKGVDIPGSYWMAILGGIMIIGGISNIINYRYNREKVLGALKSYERISLQQLSSELKLSEKRVKSLIIDLRTEGRLRASFEPETGDVLILDIDGNPPSAVVPMSSSGLPEHEEKYKHLQVPRDQNYCPHCGSIVKPESQYCNNCGSYLK
ncbi:MAG: zinc-ribbon domain-containing protein [Candidatus Thorarchaeota archaeon]